MRIIFKIIIILFFFLGLFVLTNIYTNFEKPSYPNNNGRLNVSINFNKQNYSNSSNAIIYINTSWVGSDKYNINEYYLHLYYIGSNSKQIKSNISNSVSKYYLGSNNNECLNKNLNVTNLGYKKGYSPCFNFALSSSKPNYKEIWNFTCDYYNESTGQGSYVKVRSGYFAYYKSVIAGGTIFDKVNITSNFPYIHILNSSINFHHQAHVLIHDSKKRQINKINCIPQSFSLSMIKIRGVKW
ncbi:MAG: hypothetical protein ACYDAO_06220 [Thermoplasmataceae archaeon]